MSIPSSCHRKPFFQEITRLKNKPDIHFSGICISTQRSDTMNSLQVAALSFARENSLKNISEISQFAKDQNTEEIQQALQGWQSKPDFIEVIDQLLNSSLMLSKKPKNFLNEQTGIFLRDFIQGIPDSKK